ncbi:MAG: PHB depolymerase family esterase [Pseudomonadota bacterium]
MRIWLTALVIAIALTSAHAETCGGPEAPCAIEGGVYHVALPEGDARPPVVLWLHGHGGSGAGAVKGFATNFTKRGYAVVAPTGQQTLLSKTDWSVSDGLDWPRDDVAFLKAVLADATSRFGLDRERVLVAGFSRGGSMAWELACRAPEIGAAYAAVAGAFWEPMVAQCPSPVHLNHTHGFTDRLVPFEGRKVEFQGFAFHQGSVMKGIDVWREANGCMTSGAHQFRTDGGWEKSWHDCEEGSITLTLTQGGHGIPKGWTARVLIWFESLQE